METAPQLDYGANKLISDKLKDMLYSIGTIKKVEKDTYIFQQGTDAAGTLYGTLRNGSSKYDYKGREGISITTLRSE